MLTQPEAVAVNRFRLYAVLAHTLDLSLETSEHDAPFYIGQIKPRIRVASCKNLDEAEGFLNGYEKALRRMREKS